ncbi:MAG TPA: hypothetical protein VGY76_10460 [Solirubrobacteraceae bacterium]|jgi:2-hydroxychromene-2-carboxylate isomerase|nr:hypothetical protein [Solirubrobacteraceae bacterium]
MAAPGEQQRSELGDAGTLRDPQVPLVVLDLASVETYLLLQPLTGLARESAGAIWCPLASDPAPLDLDRESVAQVAATVDLHLSWPVRHPAAVPRAMRVAALACSRGQGASVMFALSRVAFGGGGDVDEPAEYLRALKDTDLAAREARLAAESGSHWEGELCRLARELAALGIQRAPALRWGGRLYLGSRAIASVLGESSSSQPPLRLP